MTDVRPACAGKTDLFFSDNRHDRVKAQSICMGCPLLEECRERVLHAPARERFGVWAGMTEDKLRRARMAAGVNRRYGPGVVAACGTDSGYSRHVKRGEPTCAACREAHRQAESARNARKRMEASAVEQAALVDSSPGLRRLVGASGRVGRSGAAA